MNTAEQTQAEEVPLSELTEEDRAELKKYLLRMSNDNDALPGEASMLVKNVNRILEKYGHSLSDLGDHPEWLLGQGGDVETQEMLAKYVEANKKLSTQNAAMHRENIKLRSELKIPSPAKKTSSGDKNNLVGSYVLTSQIFPPAIVLGAILHKEVRNELQGSWRMMLLSISFSQAVLWGSAHLVDNQAVKRLEHLPKTEEARNSIVCPGDRGVVCKASFSATPYYLSWFPFTDKEMPAGAVYRKILKKEEHVQTVNKYDAHENLEETKKMKRTCQAYADVVSDTGLPGIGEFEMSTPKRVVCSDFKEIKSENSANLEMNIST